MKFDFFLNLLGWRLFYNEEFSIHPTIQPSGVVLRGVLEHQLRKLFAHYEIGYKSKNLRAAVKIFNAQVNHTFLKTHAENLMKVTRIMEVMGRKRSPTLRKFSFKIHY